MDYREAWSRYCSVKGWRQAGKHVEWACEQDGDTLIVYFQGSYETIDWVRDLMIQPVHWDLLPMRIHKGFSKMGHDLLVSKDFCDDVVYAGVPKIMLIGYSSGAALAALFAYYFADFIAGMNKLGIKNSWGEIVSCYLFATPQVSWLRPLDTLCEDVTLVRLDKDPVPKVLGLFGYRKVKGKEVVLKSRASVFKSHLPASYTEAINEANE